MRGKRIVLLAHCCLDQNAVLPKWERAEGAYPFTELLLQRGIGIVQLPCPETLALGVTRPPLSYNDYNTAAHRLLCEQLCDIPLRMIHAHMTAGTAVLGIIGIQDSPNCGIYDKRGVFMEILLEKLADSDIDLPFLEVPVSYVENNETEKSEFNKQLEEWLSEQ